MTRVHRLVAELRRVQNQKPYSAWTRAPRSVALDQRLETLVLPRQLALAPLRHLHGTLEVEQAVLHLRQRGRGSPAINDRDARHHSGRHPARRGKTGGRRGRIFRAESMQGRRSCRARYPKADTLAHRVTKFVSTAVCWSESRLSSRSACSRDDDRGLDSSPCYDPMKRKATFNPKAMKGDREGHEDREVR